MKRLFNELSALAFCSLLCAASAHAVPIELLTNGDFETGDFSGWTVTDLPSIDPGTFSISTPGDPTPISGSPTAPNPAGGAFYAVSDQFGPGTHALTQSFMIPADATSAILSFQMFVNDADDGPIFGPLDHTGLPVQYATVDILTAASSVFDTGAGVVTNLYSGVDPQVSNPNAYTDYMFDIFPFITPGSSYQVRFAESDNQLFLNQGVDNVSILTDNLAIPEPASLLMFALGIAAIVGIRRRKLC